MCRTPRNTLVQIAGCSTAWRIANCMHSSMQIRRKMFSGSTGCSLKATCRPELKHNYDSPRHANIGGMDFYLLGCPTTGNSTVLSVRSSSSYDT